MPATVLSTSHASPYLTFATTLWTNRFHVVLHQGGRVITCPKWHTNKGQSPFVSPTLLTPHILPFKLKYRHFFCVIILCQQLQTRGAWTSWPLCMFWHNSLPFCMHSYSCDSVLGFVIDGGYYLNGQVCDCIYSLGWRGSNNHCGSRKAVQAGPEGWRRLLPAFSAATASRIPVRSPA